MASTTALPTTNTQVLLAERPAGLPDEKTFRVVQTPVQQTLADKEVLLQTLFASVDPAMRGWITDQKSYVPPVAIDSVMRAGGLCKVIKSNNHDFKEGDIVSCLSGWQQYSVSRGDGLKKVPSLPNNIPLSVWLGPVGLTGLTAYFGLLEVGKPKSGETVLVSGAAGATGSIVGQIAKEKGCRVVGLAGSAAKCEWLVKECGFDAAINYREASKEPEGLAGAIKKECPAGVDVYYDNVGGEILDMVLLQINKFARIVMCGAISQYNSSRGEQYGVKNTVQLVFMSASMVGFIVTNYMDRFNEGVEYLSKLLVAGKLKYHEHIVDGIENAPKAFPKLFNGTNEGKLIIKVAL